MKIKFLLESKEDQQRFIDKFGQKVFDDFQKQKNILKKNDISVDLTYHTKNTSVEDMKDILSNNQTGRQKVESEIDKILSMPESNDVEKLGNYDGYEVYKINSPEASVKYGLVVGGKTGWCISGGYYNVEGGLLEEATKYFNDYLKRYYKDYFFVIGHGTKYCICVKTLANEDYFTPSSIDIWNQDDETVKEIPYLNSTIIYNGYCIYKIDERLQQLKESDGTWIYDEKDIPDDYRHLIKNVIIEDGVTKIGKFAFLNCKSLQSVTIPNSVERIEESAFNNCKSLESITIPSSVTRIGMYAFASCTLLKSITIPNSIEEIGYDVFSNCTSLESITIPNSVTKIGMFAFMSCTSLKSITIPSSVTKIEKFAFRNCTSLQSITIPNSITIIGAATFYNCTSLKDVYYSGTKNEWNNIDIMYDNESLLSANIHFNSKSTNESYKFRFKNQLTESIHSIGSNEFIIDSPYTMRDLILNKPKPYRILYDANIDSYLVGDANDTIHYNLLKDAIKAGYYNGVKVKDEYLQEVIDDMVKYKDSGSISLYFDNDYYEYLVFIIFIPNGVDPEKINYSPLSDGYNREFQVSSGTIYTRDADESWDKNCDLLKLLLKLS